MGPLNREARREGHKAMEESITAAARVRRKFKAGRPRALVDRTIGPMEAMNQTATQLDKLRGLMQEAGLDPADVRALLVYQLPETPGMEGITRVVALEVPEQLPTFIDKVMALDRPLFLGVLLTQLDRQANEQGKPGGTVIVWPFPAGAKDEASLIGMREHVAKLLSVGGDIAAIAN
jgi:hypothetical protein